MIHEEINKAVEVLKRGGIILYPTDTVWGIGCDATNPEAVQKIYDLKGSVNKKGMIVLLDEPISVGRYIRRVPEVAWDLMELSDKPLTLILDGAVGVAPNLIPEEGSLAVRVAAHDFCRGVVRRLRRPLVSTSANFSGEPTPTTFEDIVEGIKSGVDHVVSPAVEGNPTRQASSIMILHEDGSFQILL